MVTLPKIQVLMGGGNIPGLADISDIPIRPVSGGYGSAQGGFYQLPPSKYWESTSPSQNQRGSQCLVKLIAATSKAWKEKYPQDTIYVGDLNAPGHLSHSQGVDVDISTKRAANMNLSSYSRERTIEYGKLWFSTKLIEYIFFNDDSARPPIQNFAKQKGYPGIIMEEAGHEDHFHVRLKRGGDCGS